ncbi:Uncharacterized protein TCM_040507 [Theobroma cacao]|uniref:Uncharacterized protein n=1 Tax=Theobroma cacao TaxID=3641 RepID=A0A061GTM8_THECC|nr:Uncharacterized protein TCM_040507 [Theobroma cacao]
MEKERASAREKGHQLGIAKASPIQMTPKSQPNLILKSQQPKLKPKSSPTYSRVPAARHDPNLMPPNSIKLKRFHPKHVLGMLAESTRRRSHRVRQKRKPEGEA